MTLYFETSWAILSTIGIANVLFGLTIVGITHGSPATAIPIVCSAAGAVANGLCYYAFYCDFPTANIAVASAVADLMWMVQEAGISFYSYAILVRVLRNRDATIFKSLFWALVLIIFAVRVLIVVTRVRAIVTGDLEFQYTLNRLHVGYFISIACLECVSAYFLLRKFASAKKLSMEASLGTGLFRYLMRSTEIRLAALALIGITRAVTYFFQPSLQVATNTASQFDRFVYTFECLFPVVIYIDMLASKIAYSHQTHETNTFGPVSSRRMSRPGRPDSGGENDEMPMCPIWARDDDFEAKDPMEPQKAISERRVSPVARPPAAMTSRPHEHGITKTVEFTVY